MHVEYKTTKRFREDCPGTIQQEIVDANQTVYSKLSKPVGPAEWREWPDDPQKYDLLIGNPVAIPEQASPGPAIFRTVSFRYCNWLQQQIRHWPYGPIIQSGPDLHFNILCEAPLVEVIIEQKRKCLGAPGP